MKVRCQYKFRRRGNHFLRTVVIESEYATIKAEYTVIENEYATIKAEYAVIESEYTIIEGESAIIENEYTVIEALEMTAVQIKPNKFAIIPLRSVRYSFSLLPFCCAFRISFRQKQHIRKIVCNQFVRKII